MEHSIPNRLPDDDNQQQPIIENLAPLMEQSDLLSVIWRFVEFDTPLCMRYRLVSCNFFQTFVKPYMRNCIVHVSWIKRALKRNNPTPTLTSTLIPPCTLRHLKVKMTECSGLNYVEWISDMSMLKTLCISGHGSSRDALRMIPFRQLQLRRLVLVEIPMIDYAIIGNKVSQEISVWRWIDGGSTCPMIQTNASQLSVKKLSLMGADPVKDLYELSGAKIEELQITMSLHDLTALLSSECNIHGLKKMSVGVRTCRERDLGPCPLHNFHLQLMYDSKWKNIDIEIGCFTHGVSIRSEV